MYVGNLSYDVKYRDMIEFMRGGGWGRFSSWPLLVFFGCGGCGGGEAVVVRIIIRVGDGSLEVRGSEAGTRARRQRASSVLPAQWESDVLRREPTAVVQGREGAGFGYGRRVVGVISFPFPGFDGAIVRRRMVELIVGVISW